MPLAQEQQQAKAYTTRCASTIACPVWLSSSGTAASEKLDGLLQGGRWTSGAAATQGPVARRTCPATRQSFERRC